MIKNKVIIQQRKFSDWKPEGIWASHNFNLKDDNTTWLNKCYSIKKYNWIDPMQNNYYTFELKKNANIYILKSNKKSVKKLRSNIKS